MSALRLFLAVAVMGYIVYTYHSVAAKIADPSYAALPVDSSQTFYMHPVDLSGCTVGLNNNQDGAGCPAAQGQGAIPSQ